MHAKTIIYKKEAEGKPMQKGEQINDVSITVKSAFAPSANVLSATNNFGGMLYFIKRSFTCLTKGIFGPLYIALFRRHAELESAGTACHLQ